MTERESIIAGVGTGPSLHVLVPTFRYNTRPVLESIDLNLPGAGLTALIGPNGSGKSTLLRIAAGLLPTDGGQVVLCGRELRGLSTREVASLVAWVPQRADTVFSMSIREMVRVGRYRMHRPIAGAPAAEEAAIDGALRTVGLDDLAERPVDTLSGGEWQRAMIARALAQESPVLLLDEPIASLDLKYQDEVYRLLSRLAAGGRLLLVADHHIEVTAAYAERIILLHEGRVAADGPPRHTLTRERLAQTFGVEVEVFADPVSGSPRVSRPGPRKDR
ncbi:MAG: ABC transporter ATP-binding protein [Candidatus Eisenbacteria bacterium]|nr:ABC transporter ATP-binding protein [Candidatus Eisenbacteria bacterium]